MTGKMMATLIVAIMSCASVADRKKTVAGVTTAAKQCKALSGSCCHLQVIMATAKLATIGDFNRNGYN